MRLGLLFGRHWRVFLGLEVKRRKAKRANKKVQLRKAQLNK